MKLGPHDTIVTGYAQPAAGPGWCNAPFWIVVRDRRNGELRQECLQPSEQSADLHLVYSTAAELHSLLLRVLTSTVERETEDEEE